MDNVIRGKKHKPNMVPWKRYFCLNLFRLLPPNFSVLRANKKNDKQFWGWAFSPVFTLTWSPAAGLPVQLYVGFLMFCLCVCLKHQTHWQLESSPPPISLPKEAFPAVAEELTVDIRGENTKAIRWVCGDIYSVHSVQENSKQNEYLVTFD